MHVLEPGTRKNKDTPNENQNCDLTNTAVRLIDMNSSKIRSSPIHLAIVTSIHPDFDSRVWKHAVSMAALGHQVDLICPWDVPAGEERKGVRILSFPKTTRRLYRPFVIPIRVLSRLIPILKNVHLVHFHDLDLLPWMALVSLFKPVVYDVHENYSEEMLVREWVPKLLRVPLYYAVLYGQLFLSQIIRNIVLVTPAQDAQFKHPRLRVFHLKNYASLSLLDEVKDDYMERADTVICVGSGYESNGTLLILEIAALLKSSAHPIRFLLPDRFASNKFRDRFLQMRQEKGLGDMVDLFPNMLPHLLMSVLNQSTIALSPNLRVAKQEMAIPTKFFEYMAAGLPIVCSDLPYAIELLTRHPIGMLAQPEDPQTFARAIVELVENRSSAYELGKEGQRIFKAQYSWDSQIQSLQAYYQSILEAT